MNVGLALRIFQRRRRIHFVKLLDRNGNLSRAALNAGMLLRQQTLQLSQLFLRSVFMLPFGFALNRFHNYLNFVVGVIKGTRLDIDNNILDSGNELIETRSGEKEP